jgi:hypothetical protein
MIAVLSKFTLELNWRMQYKQKISVREWLLGVAAQRPQNFQGYWQKLLKMFCYLIAHALVYK